MAASEKLLELQHSLLETAIENNAELTKEISINPMNRNEAMKKVIMLQLQILKAVNESTLYLAQALNSGKNV